MKQIKIKHYFWLTSKLAVYPWVGCFLCSSSATIIVVLTRVELRSLYALSPKAPALLLEGKKTTRWHWGRERLDVHLLQPRLSHRVSMYSHNRCCTANSRWGMTLWAQIQIFSPDRRIPHTKFLFKFLRWGVNIILFTFKLTSSSLLLVLLLLLIII